MTHDIIKADAEHINAILSDIRQVDIDELGNPGDVMLHSLDSSAMAWTGIIDDTPVCMFGVIPEQNHGIVWFVGTNDIKRHYRLFLRECSACVDAMHSLYPLLIAYVREDNNTSYKWLKWLGFQDKELNGGFYRMEKVAITPDLCRPTFRELVETVESALATLPQLPNEPVHRFCPGLYSRQLTMTKGSLWVSKVHLHDNFAFIMEGECTVISELGKHRYKAPAMFLTKAGTKRILEIHEDCTWVTVHPLPPGMDESTPITDIENYFTCGTLAEYDEVTI